MSNNSWLALSRPTNYSLNPGLVFLSEDLVSYATLIFLDLNTLNADKRKAIIVISLGLTKASNHVPRATVTKGQILWVCGSAVLLFNSRSLWSLSSHRYQRNPTRCPTIHVKALGCRRLAIPICQRRQAGVLLLSVLLIPNHYQHHEGFKPKRHVS